MDRKTGRQTAGTWPDKHMDMDADGYGWTNILTDKWTDTHKDTDTPTKKIILKKH